jgi:hypothetical protein
MATAAAAAASASGDAVAPSTSAKRPRSEEKAVTMHWTLTFDVESLGLYGEGFAVGAVVHDGAMEVASLFEHCDYMRTPEAQLPVADPRNRSAWIVEHVVPVLGAATCDSPRQVRDRFWALYQKWSAIVKSEHKSTLHVVADCGAPVETNFLEACVRDALEERQWMAPFPLHEVQTGVLLSGYALADERRPDELPRHHPLYDARQSARIWRESHRVPVSAIA